MTNEQWYNDLYQLYEDLTVNKTFEYNGIKLILDKNIGTYNDDLHIYLNLKNDVQWLIVIPTDKHVRYTFKISKTMINQGTVYFKDGDITEFINGLIRMYEKWKRFILIWMVF